ncbi:hypothetical protein HPS54_00275 [Prevotella sp. PCHR]|uniref:Lipocalin-like domain-containing protein n=1 Tax=Xylanibacter caecicola TaxID=2736294 RepID=A0ABX2AZV5_9BACT|nr:calycin-like domain-containing protein [Xylanibacter caecicola]NPE23965.1 hypothetical protein [Xylanibacter caecicola]
MRKIFTLIAMVTMAMNAIAADYTDRLSISLNGGEPTVSDATVSVNYKEGSDGLYEIVLKNFSFSGLPIGDVTMTDVKGDDDSEGFTWFQTDQDAVITNGGSIASLLGNKVHVTIKEGSCMKDGKLYLEISLPVNIMGGTINVEAVFGTKLTSGVSSVVAGGNDEVKGIYSIDGKRLDTMKKGAINIIRRVDGKTVKVLKK